MSQSILINRNNFTYWLHPVPLYFSVEEAKNQQLQVFVCFRRWFGSVVDLSCVCTKNNIPDDTPMFDLEDSLNKNETGNLSSLDNFFFIT